MIDELFRIGPLSITPFGVTLVLALFAGYQHLRRSLRYYRIGDEDLASSIVFACGLWGIVGGKAYYALLYRDWHLLYDRAGIVFYGGLIGGVLAFLWMVRRHRLPLATTADATVPGVALGYGVGRLGCFLVGDDYGLPTDLPWGVIFRVGLPPTTAGNLRRDFGVDVAAEIPADAWVAVHPTQLYETTLALAIWGLAVYFMRRGPRPGVLAVGVLAALAVERFLIEFLRAKDDRILGGFTVAQGISVAVLLILAAIVVAARLRRRSAGADSESEMT